MSYSYNPLMMRFQIRYLHRHHSRHALEVTQVACFSAMHLVLSRLESDDDFFNIQDDVCMEVFVRYGLHCLISWLSSGTL